MLFVTDDIHSFIHSRISIHHLFCLAYGDFYFFWLVRLQYFFSGLILCFLFQSKKNKTFFGGCLFFPETFLGWLRKSFEFSILNACGWLAEKRLIQVLSILESKNTVFSFPTLFSFSFSFNSCLFFHKFKFSIFSCVFLNSKFSFHLFIHQLFQCE